MGYCQQMPRRFNAISVYYLLFMKYYSIILKFNTSKYKRKIPILHGAEKCLLKRPTYLLFVQCQQTGNQYLSETS